MAEATSSKRQSNGDTYDNPRKKSLTHQESNSQQEQHPNAELWFGFPTMEEIAKSAGCELIVQNCLRINEQLRMSPEEAMELAMARVAFPRVPQRAWPNTRSDNKLGN